jgi:hypothetical protein
LKRSLAEVSCISHEIREIKAQVRILPVLVPACIDTGVRVAELLEMSKD